MLKIRFYSFIKFACLIISVCGDCVFNIQNEAPLFMKDFGSKSVILRKKKGNIKMAPYEVIQAYCATGIKFTPSPFEQLPISDSSIQSAEFNCTHNGILARIGTEWKFVNLNRVDIDISCNSLSLELFESHEPLLNCGNFISYAVGTSPRNLRDIVLAGICYDLDTLSTKFVTYLAHRPQYEIFTAKENPIQLRNLSLDTKIDKLDSYFDFMSQADFNDSLNIKKSEDAVLGFYDFDYDSLVQSIDLNFELLGYNYMLSIFWWRNLRLGNWKFFLEALEERSKEVNYVVYTGTYGHLQMPSSVDSCNHTKTLSIEANGRTVHAPAYIWSYISSIGKNISEEYVIIGYNSPFYQSASAAIFCKDICDDISWLRTGVFGMVRLMPTLGVVYCCRPEEVHLKFAPFPWLKPQTKALTPSVATPQLPKQ